MVGINTEKLLDLEESVASEPEPSVRTRLDRAKARRKDLRDAMGYLEFVVAEPSSTERWADAVEAALFRLGAALVDHVEETEAADGLLAQIREAEPRLSTSVGELKAEHAELFASLEHALSSFEPGGFIDPKKVRRRVVSLLGRLALHRQRGADLVYEAYQVDIGARASAPIAFLSLDS